MQTFAVFPGETEGRVNTSRRRKSEIRGAKRGGGHLGARNTCPADSKELGSSDCISVTETEGGVCHLIFVLHHKKTEYSKLCLPVLTLELQHHIAQVCLDVVFIVGG